MVKNKKTTKQIDTHCLLMSDIRKKDEKEEDFLRWMINRNENVHYMGLFMPAFSKISRKGM